MLFVAWSLEVLLDFVELIAQKVIFLICFDNNFNILNISL